VQETVIGIVFMFMFFAFQFDLYKWCIFIAGSSDIDKYSMQEQEHVFSRRQSVIKATLQVSQVAILLTFITFSIGQLVNIDEEDNYMQWTTYRNMSMSIAFGVFLMLYIFVFIKLLTQLRLHFPHFYLSEKRRLLLLGLIIIFSLLCRVWTSFMFGYMLEQILQSARDNTYLYPLMTFISIVLGLILPWCAMI